MQIENRLFSIVLLNCYNFFCEIVIFVLMLAMPYVLIVVFFEGVQYFHLKRANCFYVSLKKKILCRFYCRKLRDEYEKDILFFIKINRYLNPILVFKALFSSIF